MHPTSTANHIERNGENPMSKKKKNIIVTSGCPGIATYVDYLIERHNEQPVKSHLSVFSDAAIHEQFSPENWNPADVDWSCDDATILFGISDTNILGRCKIILERFNRIGCPTYAKPYLVVAKWFMPGSDNDHVTSVKQAYENATYVPHDKLWTWITDYTTEYLPDSLVCHAYPDPGMYV